ncbi:SurA N-terminal domain-containing protein [Sphingorhabdus sp.]|uniref:SurA N-terminal domain-containing protein n=1 Tax=Sphingorhabdus sp. TaxID=1902408 RepID=UPI0039832320
MKYRGHIIGVVCMAMLAAGCDKKPEGQVAAVVNGDEITLKEINAEIGTANIPEGADSKEIQKAALQRIVERRLLAQAAQEDGLDKTPEFLIRSRQVNDALLVQLLGQRAEKSFQVPDQAAIDKFMADNPSMFAGRKMYVVDRIQFALPADMSKLKSLESSHSMEEVAAQLNSLGIKFERGPAKMDSAQLGQQRLNQILALPSGEPFVIPENGMVTVAIITGESPLVGNKAEMAQMATQALRRQALGKTLEDRLKQARAKGDIKYQPEFAPKNSAKLGGNVAS